MSNANKALREEYEATMIGFIQKMCQIIDKAEDDPLLRAQVIIMIMECVPTVGDFSPLKESLSKIGLPNRRAIIKECVLALLPRLRDDTISSREKTKIATTIEELVALY
ncbi:MAG: hypothetical protein Q7R84_01665 [bacterium]|nr:hypothetical protein [bacterium]